MDSVLRTLERRWLETGDPVDRGRYLRARVRAQGVTALTAPDHLLRASMVFDAQPPAGVFFRDHVETLAHWLQRLLAEMTSTERAATSCMVVGPIAANYLERLPTFEVFEASLEPVAFPFMFIGTWRRFDPIRARWRFYDVWCDVQGFRGHINYQTGEVDVTSTHHEGYFATFPHGGLRTGFFQIANA